MATGNSKEYMKNYPGCQVCVIWWMEFTGQQKERGGAASSCWRNEGEGMLWGQSRFSLRNGDFEMFVQIKQDAEKHV